MSDYTKVIQERIQAGLSKLLTEHPKQVALCEEFVKRYGKTYGNDGNVGHRPLEISFITKDDDTGYKSPYSVIFRFYANPVMTPLISFGVGLYPHCCAIHQLNGFASKEEFLDFAFFKAFMKLCLSSYGVIVAQTPRLMINFVEFSRDHKYKTTDVVPEIENPDIHYPIFYKWACTFQKQEMLYVNHNTGRIIHSTLINYRG
jgi:hypothetical protein